MFKRSLLIVEGAKTEKRIFTSIFERYGFNVVDCKKLEKYDETNEEKYYASVKEIGDIIHTPISKDTIYIMQGPHNRINELIEIDKEIFDYDYFEQLFQTQDVLINFIFIIYDVDHTSEKNLEEFQLKMNDETSGMLLVSCPCIEVLGDIDARNGQRKKLDCTHLKEYKKIINKLELDNYKCSFEDYVIEHFNEIMLYYLNYNMKQFNTNNVLLHPQKIITFINNKSKRSKQDCSFWYFSTVIYVAIA